MNCESRRWLARVLADKRLNETDRLVAHALASHMDASGRVSATDAEIAEWVHQLTDGPQ